VSETPVGFLRAHRKRVPATSSPSASSWTLSTRSGTSLPSAMYTTDDGLGRLGVEPADGGISSPSSRCPRTPRRACRKTTTMRLVPLRLRAAALPAPPRHSVRRAPLCPPPPRSSGRPALPPPPAPATGPPRTCLHADRQRSGRGAAPTTPSAAAGARLFRHPLAPFAAREGERERERGGKGKKRGVRLTCGAYVGPTILKFFFAADMWGHTFYYFSEI
jgi:hypothetical protein